MRLPRNIGGEELANLLSKYGYAISRQTGSHLRLTTSERGEHHITIPKHNPLKTGTLNGIISDVAKHLGLSKEKVMRELFQ
ncbi:MAG: type II toxin-antitoxin system HicA family toxin [Firmicutes bacterium]|nr:type II toxin-antitoxin system HicA family toxin [Bacillota bacterium]